MKYKALIVDVDGTLIPNRRDGIPSQRVRDAMQKASSKLHVGVASGRPLFLLDHIFSMLSLSGPSILRGGAEIYDATTKRIVSRIALSKKDILAVVAIVDRLGFRLLMDDERKAIQVTKDNLPKQAYGLFINKLSEKDADTVIQYVSSIPTVVVYKVPDWTRGKFSIHITHVQATKQHGILKVAEILGIKTHEIIGIGDGGNDFPLLMACGLKVAMGNAFEDLKAIADYISPSVEEDGVADVIERFILSEN